MAAAAVEPVVAGAAVAVVVVAAVVVAVVDAAVSQAGYRPPSLLLQWHVTDRCNLRCVHCYQERYDSHELTFSQWLQVYEQFLTLAPQQPHNSPPVKQRAQITVTGGEPFLRPEIWDLLEIFSANQQLTFGILTNGTLLDRTAATRLARLKPFFVQLSIEGTQATHDQIRGQGNFDKTVSAIKHLVAVGLKVVLSFTAHRGNFLEFPQVALLGHNLKVFRVWADRLIPQGSGAEIQDLVLSPPETRQFFEIMKRARAQVASHWFNKTQVAMHRALQFLVAGGRPYHCTAGDTLLTVMPNGDLYPCRRMPVKVGNVLTHGLSRLYDEAPLLKALRDQQRLSSDCAGCLYASLCRGGLKCLAYALTQDPFNKDPGCWKSSPAVSQF